MKLSGCCCCCCCGGVEGAEGCALEACMLYVCVCVFVCVCESVCVSVCVCVCASRPFLYTLNIVGDNATAMATPWRNQLLIILSLYMPWEVVFHGLRSLFLHHTYVYFSSMFIFSSVYVYFLSMLTFCLCLFYICLCILSVHV